jgi:hypothetical protein
MKPFKPFFFVLLLVGLGTLAVTCDKLYAMAQIRGWLPGATMTTCTVTEKYEDIWTRIQRNGAFRLNCPNLQRMPGQRVQLSLALWLKTQVGTTLPIVQVGGLFEGNLYVQNDLGSSDGDFVVDGAFLIVEVLVIWMCVWMLAYRPRPSAMQQLFPNNSSRAERYRR